MPDHESEVADLVAQLIELRDQHRAIGDRMREVEDVLIEAMAGIDLWYVEVPGLGVVKRHSGKKRTQWQHDDLFTEVRLMARQPENRIMVDAEAGEIESEGEAVARILREAAHVDYWRLTNLRRLGLDPDQFCRTIPGRPTIEIVAP